ncbi:HNH endonuclease signature motif containing protein [Rathayibacter sp. AY1D1]|uniref:HNH endonuclease signature motif containing protein n=1 Tax=Rathayibacter sp. AY1D1 TaxID=2080542 RepID=UPI0015E3AAC0|nr:HNH endonuclease signature motif containing protein [Rathayibacter sp. AY1D1]
MADGMRQGLEEVRALGDRAALLARSAAPLHLASAEALHEAYTAALRRPEAFARGGSPAESRDLVERSVRAELAVALAVSERVAARELEHARLLVDHLPCTRAALAEARLRWEAGQIICGVAATLPPATLPEFDERAAGLAASMTPTQLRRRLARLRDELHESPLADRHARAREDRSVRVSPEQDGMATLCATLPAPAAFGALARLDRIARTLRDGSGAAEERTLAQLRADALVDLLCDGDVSGTAPGDERPRTSARGIRAEVRLTLAASTAAGQDETPAELDGYGLIPAGVARELLGADSAVTPVLTHPSTGAVVSVGRTHRLPPPRMRLALQLRDRTCRFPGCTRPAATAEADHTLEWRHGGATALDNLASLCVAHHHVRHGDRWTYTLHPDGSADWTTPTGRRVVTRPPDPPAPPAPPQRRPSFSDAPPPF